MGKGEGRVDSKALLTRNRRLLPNAAATLFEGANEGGLRPFQEGIRASVRIVTRLSSQVKTEGLQTYTPQRVRRAAGYASELIMANREKRTAVPHSGPSLGFWSGVNRPISWFVGATHLLVGEEYRDQ